MKRKLLVLSLFAGVLTAGVVLADDWDEYRHQGRHDGEHGAAKKRPKQLAVAPNAPAVWKTECGSCHMAYPPGLLPPAAWQQQMDNLKQHYGSNASLDKPDEQAIRLFLLHASATNQLPTPPVRKAGEPPRITSSGWFVRKHREVRADQWARKAVGGRSNCIACHAGADKGDFNEHQVHIPGGA